MEQRGRKKRKREMDGGEEIGLIQEVKGERGIHIDDERRTVIGVRVDLALPEETKKAPEEIAMSQDQEVIWKDGDKFNCILYDLTKRRPPICTIIHPQQQMHFASFTFLHQPSTFLMPCF